MKEADSEGRSQPLTRVPVCVFAKPPRPGVAKTRLAATIGDRAAAALAGAFLRDTWEALAKIPWAAPVLATTDVEWAARDLHLPAHQIWPQGEGDLGDRLERVMSRALSSSAAVIAIGSDSPGLPARSLDAARAGLTIGSAVIGPADDGGYYLIGLPCCRPGLLAEIPWSTPETRARTIDRLQAHGLRTQLLEPWFDIDGPVDLERLRRLLTAGVIHAPRTATILGTLVRPFSLGRTGA
jgi:rSAM/selenodomain-associated transferase 1